MMKQYGFSWSAALMAVGVGALAWAGPEAVQNVQKPALSGGTPVVFGFGGEGNQEFMLNGKPFQIRGAEMHPQRIPREYWRHRIRTAKAMGLNTIAFYVFWNDHEQPDGSFDYDAIRAAINSRTKLITIQRSKGYATRPSFSVQQIGELIAFCKNVKPDVICMVDNCYGEFVETIEPTDVGADMVVGSLIKNPGGGLAPIGGYIAGRKECVENAAFRLTSPGLGKEVGASLGVLSSFYQGLFLAPTVTASALKGAIFAASLYEKIGFRVLPNGQESRHDIIQAVTFGSPEGVIAFCQGIQAAASVDSFVTPEPWDMPGYDAKVIMAAGAFVSGSSIELSADGPIKPPYAVYFQGGLTFPHAKLGILKTLQNLIDNGLVTDDFHKI